MRFVASLTRTASELNAMMDLWRKSGDPRNPFANVMLTPLFMPSSGMKVIQQWREEGIIEQLYFDSGGFYVQMGRVEFNDLYYGLLRLYSEQRWADWYVLPDHVPLSSETEMETWQKVRDTAEYGEMFLQEMPAAIADKALPVVHGYTYEQVDYCLDSHLSLGLGYVGFGSFSTSGKMSSVNKLVPQVYTNLRRVTTRLGKHNVRLHGFGVSTPPVVYLLSDIQVFSIDSIGWLKTAGFGKVYMPYIRAYNITYYDKSARTITERQFQHLQELTGHSCYFCQSFQGLYEKRYYRALHNVSVILDMLDDPNARDTARLVMPQYAPEYATMLNVGAND